MPLWASLVDPLGHGWAIAGNDEGLRPVFAGQRPCSSVSEGDLKPLDARRRPAVSTLAQLSAGVLVRVTPACGVYFRTG